LRQRRRAAIDSQRAASHHGTRTGRQVLRQDGGPRRFPRSAKGRALVVPGLLSLALAACGSTVQMQGTAPGGGGLTQPGLDGTPGAVGLGGTGGLEGTSTGGPGGAVGEGGAPGSPNPTSVGTSGSTTSPRPVLQGRGKRAPIEVGIVLYPDISEFAGAFGGEVDTGDQDLITETAVRWVNAHGGAAGHPVKVVKYYFELTSSKTYSQIAQEACEHFTVDHHVVAVLAPGTVLDNNFPACLKRTGTQLLMSAHYIRDAKDWQQVPNLWSVFEADGGDIARAMVDQVLKRPLAKSGEKVGLMTMTEPAAVRAANGVIKPELKAAGIDVVEYTVPPPASTADIGNSVAVVNSAELRMAAEGIETVLFLCPGCLPFFARQADSQQYYPRYLGSSLDQPLDIKGAAYERSMKSAILLGWLPHKDVGLYRHPKELTDNPNRKLCHTIMDPIRQSTGDPSEYVTQAICDGFLQVWQAAKLNPAHPLKGPDLQIGLGRIGTGFPSAVTYGTNQTPSRHGGVTHYRTMHWDSSAQAFVYDSPRRLAFR